MKTCTPKINIKNWKHTLLKNFKHQRVSRVPKTIGVKNYYWEHNIFFAIIYYGVVFMGFLPFLVLTVDAMCICWVKKKNSQINPISLTQPNPWNLFYNLTSNSLLIASSDSLYINNWWKLLNNNNLYQYL